MFNKNKMHRLFRKSNPNYWENRYEGGGNSGNGSIGPTRRWKWDVISKHLKTDDMSVIDLGCGDLRFWEGKECKSYVGIDLSNFIVNKNQSQKPQWAFINGNTANRYPLTADVVFCMDMLFHVMSDEDYQKILERAIEYSSKFIVLYTWDSNPIKGGAVHDDYQFFRRLDTDKFNGFEMIAHEINPHSSCGAIYIFKKGD